MFKLFRNFEILFYPPDGDGGGGGSSLGEVSDLDQDMALLGEDGEDDPNDDAEGDPDANEEEESGDPKADEEDEQAEEEEEEEKSVKKEGEEEEDDKEKEKEGETDEEKAKKIEGKPTFGQIKAKFPEVLKAAPGLRDVLFREQGFSKVFADPSQAEEAATKAGFYDELEASLVADANPGVLFKELSENNPAAFKRMVPNILSEIRKIDSHLYLDAFATPIIEELLFHASKAGETKNNVNLVRSAKHIADFFSGSPEIKDITKKTEKHPAEIELERVQNETAGREQKSALNEINGFVDKSLRAMVVEGLPRTLTPFVREAVIEKVLDKLMENTAKDQAFGLKARTLWRKARVAGYSDQTKAAIKNAHVARARSVIREVRDSVLKEANIDGVKKGQQQPDKKLKKRQFESVGRGGGGGKRLAVLDSSKIDYKQTSDLDILEDNGGDRIKLRGKR